MNSGPYPSLRKSLILGAAAQIVAHMVENSLRANEPMGVDRMWDAMCRYNAIVAAADEMAEQPGDIMQRVLDMWEAAAPPFRTADSMLKLGGNPNEESGEG